MEPGKPSPMGAEPVGNTPERMTSQIDVAVKRFGELATKASLPWTRLIAPPRKVSC
jgi:hypothetical protein